MLKRVGFFLGLAAMIGGLFCFYSADSVYAIGDEATNSSPTPTVTIEEAIAAGDLSPTPTPKEDKEKITEPSEEIKGRLTLLLESQELKTLNWSNFLKHAIRVSVAHEIPANTIVLILLVPVIATLIASVRHIVGISGFGIFTPVMISVAFIATGLSQGLFLFVVVLSVALVTRTLLRRVRVHFLPRMSLLLWAICLAVFGLLYLGPQLGFEDVADISIFPILVMILLTENFIEVLIGKSSGEAFHLTWQTLFVAILGYWLFNWHPLQEFVLLSPEIVFLLVLVVNIFLGRYTRLRWTEFRRFRSLFKS